MKPTLIITRPAPQAARFAQQLRSAWTKELRIILSPLLQIVPHQVDVPPVAGLIFTSTNGVAQAERLTLKPGLPAFCVGTQTAMAAQAAGFQTIAGQGNAEGLVQEILAHAPTGPLAHIRGQHARGHVSEALNQAGINCIDVVAYDQIAVPLTAEAIDALSGDAPLIIPLFSPRTAALLADQGPFEAPLHVVAISASALPDLPLISKHIAERPDGIAMALATIGCMQGMVRGDG